jgi:hypothetical protein
LRRSADYCDARRRRWLKIEAQSQGEPFTLRWRCWGGITRAMRWLRLRLPVRLKFRKRRLWQRCPRCGRVTSAGSYFDFNGATVINDSYNSNPEALRSMILALAARPAERRILVAGEMLELGVLRLQLHAACAARFAAEAQIDVILGVRGNAEHLVLGASDAGVAGVDTLFLPDAEAAGAWLKQNLRSGDVALVKGSRGICSAWTSGLLRMLHQ